VLRTGFRSQQSLFAASAEFNVRGVEVSRTMETVGMGMRKLSAKDTTLARKNFSEAYEQTKLDLIKAARDTGTSERHPEYLWPDGTEDAWFHRKSAVSRVIEKRGGFSSRVATIAITDSNWETKEAVARWLRNKLKVLREAEAKTGTAPARRKVALSRTMISDIALELLECIGGDSLICLFQELLDVDRHRKSVSENFIQLDQAAATEAQLELQGVQMGVRAFASLMSVSPSSVTRWRKNPAFRERFDFHKKVWGDVLRDEYFDQIRNEATERSEAECFRRAFELYGLSLPARR
jgi:hypothetical protein